ncbi:MAG: hypothetical protein O3A46_06740, partial [Candidatus Poribacteria bacterium]|nr:hypothetical protein [Candidatus Poribacteria bacterium]
MADKQMHAWRNIYHHGHDPDAEIAAVNAMEDALGDKPDAAGHIRALITRVDSLSHYKTFDNILYLLNAIGEMSYEGMPVVDVLWRHEHIEDDWRNRVKRYATACGAWKDGVSLADAKQAHPDNGEELTDVYDALGECDATKRWLAACMTKTLKELAYTPDDVIAEHDDEAYVTAIYRTLLNRAPSPDDLQNRVNELADWK